MAAKKKTSKKSKAVKTKAQEEKNLGGRPLKYNEEVQLAADDYTDNHKDFGDLVPTVVGLALHLGVVAKTVYNWATDANPEFLHTVSRIEMLQHRGLINGGLSGAFNNSITKMMLASNHGYTERSDVNHTSLDGTMSPTRIELVAPSVDSGEK